MVFKFSTKKDLISYVIDLMGSQGNGDDAERLVDKALIEDYIELEWDGYHIVKEDEFDEDFVKLWEGN